MWPGPVGCRVGRYDTHRAVAEIQHEQRKVMFRMSYIRLLKMTVGYPLFRAARSTASATVRSSLMRGTFVCPLTRSFVRFIQA